MPAPQPKMSTTVRELKAIAYTTVSKYPKAVLDALYAKSITGEEIQKWEASGLVSENTTVKVGKDEKPHSTKWYYQPEFDADRNQMALKCLDGEHILSNLRRKVCKDGLPACGVKKEAWHRVAEENSDVISTALVKDLIDRQNSAYAQRTFSLDVEIKMREKGFRNEANFVRMIRQWYAAEDEPGIPAARRFLYRQRLKDFLLRGVSFKDYPPPGTHVKGMSLAMFEGFLCSIDAHTYLYKTVGSYNQRAIGSQDAENFFSQLTDMDPGKLGCPKAADISRQIATASRLLHYRCDPTTRIFKMRTTRNPVYPVKELEHGPVSTTITNTERTFDGTPTTIEVTDHYFDTEERCRTKRRKKRSDIADVDSSSHGEVGVHEFHKTNESKILAEKRYRHAKTDN